MVLVDKYIHFSKIEIIKDSIEYKENIGEWCKKPYPGHKHGCPNYGKKELCPPFSKFMKDNIEKYHYFYLIYAEFDFRGYKDEMSILLPDWTEKQLGCCLYWQTQLKNKFYTYVKEFITSTDLLLGCGSGFGKNIQSMESGGINVFKTLTNNNILYEDRPKNKIVLCCLLCSNVIRFE
jgi:predicted metal-binding protein